MTRADHVVVPRTDEWYTPRPIIEALGPFDLDPCAALDQPFRTARVQYTVEDNGLMQDWGRMRAWCNPPYRRAVIGRWMARIAEHGIGTALVNARTDSEWFFAYVWARASALLFIKGRIHFIPGARAVERNHNGHASVLVAYGAYDMDRLADSGIEGAFVPLATHGQMIAVLRPQHSENNPEKIEKSWVQVLTELVSRAGGEITVQAAYVLVAPHPKVNANPNFKAKVRQILQGPAFERVDRGTYRLAGVA